jgi:hypothetical protein
VQHSIDKSALEEFWMIHQDWVLDNSIALIFIATCIVMGFWLYSEKKRAKITKVEYINTVWFEAVRKKTVEYKPRRK